MATATLAPVFNEQFLIPDSVSGLPVFCAAYQLYTYTTGTTTAKTSYADQAQTTPNANPIILDARGQCSLFLGVGDYAIELHYPAAQGGALVKRWDGITPQPLPSLTTYLPLTGGTLTGLITLSGDATSSLNPVSLQQMNVAITGGTASVATSVASANAAAAAATAAVAAFTPSHFELATAAGSSATRSPTLSVGTWSVRLMTSAHIDDSVLGTGSVTITQTATVGTTTVSNSLTLHRTGGSGYGRNNMGTVNAVGSLVVTTAGPFTMTLNSVSLGAATSDGSVLILDKQ